MNKKFRVKKSDDFKKIMNHKKFSSNPSFSIYYKPKADDINRVGISVSKKIGNAVVRNKIKRQVRMMVLDIYSFEEEFDTIILVRADYTAQSFEENKKRLLKLVKNVRI